MNIALLLAEAHEAIVFQSCHKNFVKFMNELEIFRCRIPTIEQNRFRFNAFFFKGLTKHVPEVFIFRSTINSRGIHTKIEGTIIILIRMDQIYNPDAFN